MTRITIDPITRLEGYGRIEIFLDSDGEVANAYLQIPELRGFERFCEGRPVEELPRIVSRICGICPGAHHLASSKAVDAVYGVIAPPAAQRLRELYYMAHFMHSHIAHFYALAAPDFICGPEAPPDQRNLLGVIATVGSELGLSIIKHRAQAQQIQSIVLGRATQPVGSIPGGVAKPLTRQEQQQIQEMASALLGFARTSLNFYEDAILKNPGYVAQMMSDTYTIRTHDMALVDPRGKVSLLDGELRVVGPDGSTAAQFDSAHYLEYLAEQAVPWSYLKFTYLKEKGWHGIVDGPASGMYRVGPLARLNAANGMATPLAHEEYERYFSTLGSRPVHHILAMHWARLVEILYAAERLCELAGHQELCDPRVRVIPTATPCRGIGVVEAPRGVLIHDYQTDEQGIVQRLNLIVATAHNYGPICLSIKNAARDLIQAGKEISEGLLNRVEMAFRAYDPCFGCATHALPGRAPMEAVIYDEQHRVVQVLRRN